MASLTRRCVLCATDHAVVLCLPQISAKFGQGVDDLLETILLQAEVEELSARPDKAAKGTVIEAHLDRRRGPVATLLVQAGTLRIGDMVVASASYGKVRPLDPLLLLQHARWQASSGSRGAVFGPPPLLQHARLASRAVAVGRRSRLRVPWRPATAIGRWPH